MTQYWCKYRGEVLDTLDPLGLGRLRANVPRLDQQAECPWALPCAPAAGRQHGLFVMPAVGSHVWIEFEGGDPALPIWTGGFWTSAEDVPACVAGSHGAVVQAWQSGAANAVVLDDTPGLAGGVRLRSAGGATIVVNDEGIFIDNGKGASIHMVGPSVSINHGALEIV